MKIDLIQLLLLSIRRLAVWVTNHCKDYSFIQDMSNYFRFGREPPDFICT